MSKKRIGWACKYMHSDRNIEPKTLKEIEKKYNTRTTTRTWLNKQTNNEAEARLWEIITHNIQSVKNTLNYIGELPNELHFFRISSDILPFYSEQYWSYFYRKPDTKRWLEHSFAGISDIARDLDIRLSCHPGQFTCLASDRNDVLENSIKEFEYHADMIRWMGFGNKFQDFKCNVHIGGKLGPEGIRAVYPRLSSEARNTITIENDEFGWGIESCLELSDIIPIVLDVHHHYIRTNGEYIQPNDHRINKIIDSWRGVRPVIHYSVSREEYVKDNNILPDMKDLLNEGIKPQKLRAHSDMFNNRACNKWIFGFWEKFDIMCESKHKNLASTQLLDFFKNYDK
ncbi:MAG: UV DNA damage repair endonuclease UvsE [bacterium]